MSGTKSYQCENCGNVMTFDPVSQTLKCENCGHSISIINDPNKVVEHVLTRADLMYIKAEEKVSRTMECKGCGAQIEVYDNLTSTECPYCGSQYVLKEKQEAELIPDGVLPFLIDKKQVGEIFRDWLKGRWLAPGALKNLYQTGKLMGIYLPYWTFDAEASAYYTALGGRHRTVHRRGPDGEDHVETVTDWYHTSGNVARFFDDVLVRASDKLDARLLAKVEPFDTNNASSYDPDYFAGYSAECFSRNLDEAHVEARNKMENALYAMAESDVLITFDEVRNVSISSNYWDETYKHVILPVYTTTYHFKDQTYNVIINGQSGKISGDYPKSWVKIFFIILCVVAVIAIIAFVLLNN